MSKEVERNKGSTKTSYISIPNELINNSDINIKAKYLYIILKKHSTKHKTKVSTLIKYDKLNKSLMWNDKRKLKRYLSILKELNYIKYDFKEINNYIPLEIEFINHKQFIMIARDIVDKTLLINIDNSNSKRGDMYYIEKGIVYLYFLEGYYNEYWGYACPSRRELSNIIKTNNSDTTKIIKYYHNNYICEYCQGKVIGEKDKPMRARNRYIPNNIDINGNKRYMRHKKESYFFKDSDEFDVD